jgi:hypothetical protein
MSRAENHDGPWLGALPAGQVIYRSSSGSMAKFVAI